MSDGAAGNRDRIRALLGGREYATLFEAVRRRLEDAGCGPARSVALPPLDANEAAALAGLMGWPRLPAAGERLRLEALDGALRDSGAGLGLREVLELLGGPLVDRPGLRAEARGARGALWSRASALLEHEGRADLAPWLEELRDLGLVSRAASAAGEDEAPLLDRAIACACRLPADGVLLPVLASEVAGDAHALDPGRPLGGLVLRAAARLAGWPEVPALAGARRRLWAEVGVLCDPVSSQVLVLGLLPEGPGMLARHLRDAAEAGEPRRLTLRELKREGCCLPPGTVVSICENPSVVAAAADRLGSSCSPVVCVEGQPSTAAVLLLRSLATAGARLRFHADFDWSGIRIGNQLVALGATPWRFSAADYTAALGRMADPIALTGREAEADWDPELGPELRRAARAVFEEQVIEDLLSDFLRIT